MLNDRDRVIERFDEHLRFAELALRNFRHYLPYIKTDAEFMAWYAPIVEAGIDLDGFGEPNTCTIDQLRELLTSQ